MTVCQIVYGTEPGLMHEYSVAPAIICATHNCTMMVTTKDGAMCIYGRIEVLERRCQQILEAKAMTREFEDALAHTAALEAEIERLQDLVVVAQPEMERIEFIEASSDDGYGTRLITLRQWLINARRALEPKP